MAPPSVRVDEGAFLSETTVDEWVHGGVAAVTGGVLATPEGRRFFLSDAIRVLDRRNGDTDPYGVTGRVETIRNFIRHGAIISAHALRLGPAIYDVEYGFVATDVEGKRR